MNQSEIDLLRTIRLFLLDLDGTVYLDSTPVPGALDFIRHLERSGIDYLFLTNNSSRSASEYVGKLRGMGFPVTEHHVCTSGQVTGWYLSRTMPDAKLYLVGNESLRKELDTYGLSCIENPGDRVDYVVVGFDTELTYHKLSTATRLLAEGACFIATNPDLVCPVGNGRYLPDCGSICMLLENASGKQPVFMGKPHTKLLDFIGLRRKIARNTTAIIGDRLSTDIALGINSSILSICTLTGESDLSTIGKSSCKPDMIIGSVAELIPCIPG